jgi:hypothetical protein
VSGQICLIGYFSRVHVPDGVLGNLEIAGMLLTRPSLLSQLLIPNAHVPKFVHLGYVVHCQLEYGITEFTI